MRQVKLTIISGSGFPGKDPLVKVYYPPTASAPIAVTETRRNDFTPTWNFPVGLQLDEEKSGNSVRLAVFDVRGGSECFVTNLLCDCALKGQHELQAANTPCKILVALQHEDPPLPPPAPLSKADVAVAPLTKSRSGRSPLNNEPPVPAVALTPKKPGFSAAGTQPPSPAPASEARSKTPNIPHPPTQLPKELPVSDKSHAPHHTRTPSREVVDSIENHFGPPLHPTVPSHTGGASEKQQPPISPPPPPPQHQHQHQHSPRAIVAKTLLRIRYVEGLGPGVHAMLLLFHPPGAPEPFATIGNLRNGATSDEFTIAPQGTEVELRCVSTKAPDAGGGSAGGTLGSARCDLRVAGELLRVPLTGCSISLGVFVSRIDEVKTSVLPTPAAPSHSSAAGKVASAGAMQRPSPILDVAEPLRRQQQVEKSPAHGGAALTTAAAPPTSSPIRRRDAPRTPSDVVGVAAPLHGLALCVAVGAATKQLPRRVPWSIVVRLPPDAAQARSGSHFDAADDARLLRTAPVTSSCPAFNDIFAVEVPQRPMSCTVTLHDCSGGDGRELAVASGTLLLQPAVSAQQRHPASHVVALVDSDEEQLTEVEIQVAAIRAGAVLPQVPSADLAPLTASDHDKVVNMDHLCTITVHVRRAALHCCAVGPEDPLPSTYVALTSASTRNCRGEVVEGTTVPEYNFSAQLPLEPHSRIVLVCVWRRRSGPVAASSAPSSACAHGDELLGQAELSPYDLVPRGRAWLDLFSKGERRGVVLVEWRAVWYPPAPPRPLSVPVAAAAAARSLRLWSGVTLEVVEARDLPRPDLGGTCNPYCTVAALPLSAHGDELRTAVVRGATSPVWNQAFSIVLKPREMAGFIFTVLDDDIVGGDNAVGMCVFRCDSALWAMDSGEAWLPLEPRTGPQLAAEPERRRASCGALLVRWRFHGEATLDDEGAAGTGSVQRVLADSTSSWRLSVRGLAAKGLPLLDPAHLLHPALELEIARRSQRLVCPVKTQAPAFDGEVSFDFRGGGNGESLKLVLRLFDVSFGRETFIGQAEVDLARVKVLRAQELFELSPRRLADGSFEPKDFLGSGSLGQVALEWELREHTGPGALWGPPMAAPALRLQIHQARGLVAEVAKRRAECQVLVRGNVGDGCDSGAEPTWRETTLTRRTQTPLPQFGGEEFAFQWPTLSNRSNAPLPVLSIKLVGRSGKRVDVLGHAAIRAEMLPRRRGRQWVTLVEDHRPTAQVEIGWEHNFVALRSHDAAELERDGGDAEDVETPGSQTSPPVDGRNVTNAYVRIIQGRNLRVPPREGGAGLPHAGAVSVVVGCGSESFTAKSFEPSAHPRFEEEIRFSLTREQIIGGVMRLQALDEAAPSSPSPALIGSTVIPIASLLAGVGGGGGRPSPAVEGGVEQWVSLVREDGKTPAGELLIRTMGLLSVSSSSSSAAAAAAAVPRNGDNSGDAAGSSRGGPAAAVVGVRLEVVRAHNILPMDLCGTSDAFAVVRWGAQTCRTAVTPKSLDPVWNEGFTLLVPDAFETPLQIFLLDKDNLGDDEDFLGSVSIDCATLFDVNSRTSRVLALGPVMEDGAICAELAERIASEGGGGGGSGGGGSSSSSAASPLGTIEVRWKLLTHAELGATALEAQCAFSPYLALRTRALLVRPCAAATAEEAVVVALGFDEKVGAELRARELVSTSPARAQTDFIVEMGMAAAVTVNPTLLTITLLDHRSGKVLAVGETYAAAVAAVDEERWVMCVRPASGITFGRVLLSIHARPLSADAVQGSLIHFNVAELRNVALPTLPEAAAERRDGDEQGAVAPVSESYFYFSFSVAELQWTQRSKPFPASATAERHGALLIPRFPLSLRALAATELRVEVALMGFAGDRHRAAPHCLLCGAFELVQKGAPAQGSVTVALVPEGAQPERPLAEQQQQQRRASARVQYIIDRVTAAGAGAKQTFCEVVKIRRCGGGGDGVGDADAGNPSPGMLRPTVVAVLQGADGEITRLASAPVRCVGAACWVLQRWDVGEGAALIRLELQSAITSSFSVTVAASVPRPPPQRQLPAEAAGEGGGDLATIRGEGRRWVPLAAPGGGAPGSEAPAFEVLVAWGHEQSGAPPPSATLDVTIDVVEARGLRPADRNGLADPYTVVTFTRGRRVERVKTDVVAESLAPKWRRGTFTFELTQADREAGVDSGVVSFLVCDHDEGDEDDLMGAASLQLGAVDIAGDQWLPLRNERAGGEVVGELRVRWEVQRARLERLQHQGSQHPASQHQQQQQPQPSHDPDANLSHAPLVVVEIPEARRLLPVQLLGQSTTALAVPPSCFVRISRAGDGEPLFKSSIVTSTDAPRFTPCAAVEVPRGTELSVTLWHRYTASGPGVVFMGEARIVADVTASSGGTSQWVALRPRAQNAKDATRIASAGAAPHGFGEVKVRTRISAVLAREGDSAAAGGAAAERGGGAWTVALSVQEVVHVNARDTSTAGAPTSPVASPHHHHHHHAPFLRVSHFPQVEEAIVSGGRPQRSLFTIGPIDATVPGESIAICLASKARDETSVFAGCKIPLRRLSALGRMQVELRGAEPASELVALVTLSYVVSNWCLLGSGGEEGSGADTAADFSPSPSHASPGRARSPAADAVVASQRRRRRRHPPGTVAVGHVERAECEEHPPVGVAVVERRGRVFAVGGYCGEGWGAGVAVFSQQTMRWSPLDLQHGALRREGHSCVAHGNRLVVFGGCGPGGLDRALSTIRGVYEDRKSVYSVHAGDAPPSMSMSESARVAFERGEDSDTPTAAAAAAAASRQQGWASMASAPDHSLSAVSTIGGGGGGGGGAPHHHASGGPPSFTLFARSSASMTGAGSTTNTPPPPAAFAAHGYYDSTVVFDLGSRLWAPLRCTGTKEFRADHSAVLVGDLMIVFGGWSLRVEERRTRQHHRHRPRGASGGGGVGGALSSGSEAELTPLRSRGAKPPLSDTISAPTGSRKAMRAFRPVEFRRNDVACLDLITGHWSNVRPRNAVCPCPPVSGHTAVMVAGRMVVFGGAIQVEPDSDAHFSAELFSFDFNACEWAHHRKAYHWPCPRAYHSACALDDYSMLVSGGAQCAGGGGGYDASIWQLHMASGIFARVSIGPHVSFWPRIAGGCAVIPGKNTALGAAPPILVVCGGVPGSDDPIEADEFWCASARRDVPCTMGGQSYCVSLASSQ